MLAPLASTVQEDESRASRASYNPALAPGKGIRAQRLKDLLLEKEMRNDISTAEFALKLDMPRVEPGARADGKDAGSSASAPFSSMAMTPRGVIDYEKIAEKLEKSLELIDRRQGRLAAAVARTARGESGTGSSTPRSIGEESTLRVTKRLNDTRVELQNVLSRVRQSMSGPTKGDDAGSSTTASGAGSASMAGASAAATGGEDGDRPLNPLTVFVREDGTVDWDGAFQSGKELAKYSGEVFQRLQGESPGEEAHAPKVSTSLATIDASPGMQVLQQFLRELESELRSAEDERDKYVDFAWMSGCVWGGGWPRSTQTTGQRAFSFTLHPTDPHHHHNATTGSWNCTRHCGSKAWR